MALEIERKFLVKKEEGLKFLENEGFIVEGITQVYIEKEKGRELRIRCIEDLNSDHKYFTKTLKLGNGLVRDEFEDEISEEEYNDLYKKQIAKILKIRYSIKDTTECFDIYPSHDLITFEIEFDSEEKALNYVIPYKYKDIIDKEISGDKQYSNYQLALELLG
jgi:adenylate cyclase